MIEYIYDEQQLALLVEKEEQVVSKFEFDRLSEELKIRKRQHEVAIEKMETVQVVTELFARYVAVKNCMRKMGDKQTKSMKYHFVDIIGSGKKLSMNIEGKSHEEKQKIKSAGYMYGMRNGKKFRTQTKNDILTYWFE